MIGDRLGGFAIEKKLGQGGMGAVFAARSASGERCALKVLSQDLSGDAKARARFSHECKLLRDLDHPRIVRALSELLEEGDRCFYAMELVTGEDLDARVERKGALPVAEAVAIASDVLEALSVAHERGVLHRDVKPSNVFVDEAGRAKLGDFGIALVSGATRHTRPGTTLGTPEFMAPELARGEEPSVRTDLYAVGILLWFLLEGRPPFRASQPLAVLKMHCEEPPPALSARVPARLALVIARALAKKPEERFLSAQELRGALRASVEPPDEGRRPPSTAAELARAETRPLTRLPAPLPATDGAARPASKRRRNLVLVVAALLLLAGLAGHGKPPSSRGPSVLVHLRDGSSIEGELLKLDADDDSLLVRLANGTEHRLPLGDVASYEKTDKH